ncbi:MAG: type I-E CRISPR-associated protein Cas7/Cse4/CasC [Alteromonadaceae bacterium]|nr:MAG: type I-E CRISPR-associated protein Cas7/Cse4/CasC [Alteromonadaceae bacterium]
MSRFLQLHFLTSYPPANLNRDDLGRPKTAKMGGVDRLRVSSQSLKRTWRTSELFKSALNGHIGERTKILGKEVFDRLCAGGVAEKSAKAWSKEIAKQFGKLKKEDKNKPHNDLEIEQLMHLSRSERDNVDLLVDKLITEIRKPSPEELKLLRKEGISVDIALFGRMLASSPEFNIEAACQVAHAISVHATMIEDDYFTAVDDLNTGADTAGAAHIGEAGFAAGLFYSYICINKALLLENLGNDEALVKKTIAALTEAALKVSPEGKQNSFASRAYASYVLAESGDQQPRSLSVAYLKPIAKDCQDFASEAITALNTQVSNFDQVYGACAESRYQLNTVNVEGSLDGLLAFVSE